MATLFHSTNLASPHASAIHRRGEKKERRKDEERGRESVQKEGGKWIWIQRETDIRSRERMAEGVLDCFFFIGRLTQRIPEKSRVQCVQYLHSKGHVHNL